MFDRGHMKWRQHPDMTTAGDWDAVEKVEEMYYPCSQNKGADKLRSYCEADLHLCFRISRLLVFS